jgi:hypothetical protein
MGHPVRFRRATAPGGVRKTAASHPTDALAAAAPGGRRLTVSAQLLARLFGRPVPAGRTRR